MVGDPLPGQTVGRVYLIGAGPGDPGLFTLRGVERLREATVILQDYLADDAILEHARPEAEIIYVGKKAADHTLTQDEINALLAEKARAGHTVARLKGGDCYIFGRGGEEAEYLHDQGIPFEVVPGIPSPIGASCYAGIPLTHRDFTSTLAFVTGHEDPGKETSSIDWEALARGIGTLVFFMGVRNLPRIAANLIAGGKSPDTPAAVIRWGTKPIQQTVTGTLATIAQEVERAGLKPPALTLVGEVVTLREKLNWFETRPLFGRTILVTRSRAQASEFRVLLERLGARCLEFPTIAIRPLADPSDLDAALQRLRDYDWLIFTSVNGWWAFANRLQAIGLDLRALGDAKICAIGPATRDAIESCRIRVDALPRQYRAESVIEALAEESLEGERILIPRARVAREILPEALEKRGARVDVIPVYETICPESRTEEVRELLRNRQVDMVTFTSSSTATNFRSMFRDDEFAGLMQGVDVGVISPVTGETVRAIGLEPNCVAETYTIPGLADAIRAHYAGGKARS